jgi:hypothetical protein
MCQYYYHIYSWAHRLNATDRMLLHKLLSTNHFGILEPPIGTLPGTKVMRSPTRQISNTRRDCGEQLTLAESTEILWGTLQMYTKPGSPDTPYTSTTLSLCWPDRSQTWEDRHTRLFRCNFRNW